MQTLLILWALLASLWQTVAPQPLPPLGTEPVDLILVDKSDRTLSLVRDGETVRTYAVGLGFEPEGDKARQGDGRTPEGIFHIGRRNDASRFHLSLGLDYPRPEDVARASAGGYSPGGDIFIHGQPNGLDLGPRARVAGDWTDGCVAVTNANIEEVWAVAPLGTTVEIRP